MLIIPSAMASCQRVRHVKRRIARRSARPPTTTLPVAKNGGTTRPNLPSAVGLLTWDSYVTALELEIERLEKRLTYARLRKASVAMHDPDVKSEPRDSPTFAASPTPEATPTPDSGRKDSLAVIRDAIHRKAARKRENSDVNTLVSDFGYM